MSAAAGIVRIQAHTIRPATPHRTADNRRVEPTPTIAPVKVANRDSGRAVFTVTLPLVEVETPTN